MWISLVLDTLAKKEMNSGLSGKIGGKNAAHWARTGSLYLEVLCEERLMPRVEKRGFNIFEAY